ERRRKHWAMVGKFDHGASCGCGTSTAFLGRSPADRLVRSSQGSIGPRGGGRSRLTGSAGRVLPAREQSFTLELKQPGFDRTGTTKSPQQACQPMNERKLEHGSRINTADEDTLERSVGSSMFEGRNDGLVSKRIA